MLTIPVSSGAKGPPFKSGRVYFDKSLGIRLLRHDVKCSTNVELFDKDVENLRRWRHGSTT